MLGPVTVVDTFSRTLDETQGWGGTANRTDSGHAWVQSIPTYTSGGWGLMDVPTTEYQGGLYLNLQERGIPKQSQDSILFCFKYSSPFGSTGIQTDFGPMLSYDSNTYYGLALKGGINELELFVVTKGSRIALTTRSMAISYNTTYWCRFERTSSGIRAKMWREGIEEPSSWHITYGVYIGSGAPQTGNPGFWRRGTATDYRIHIASLYYTRSGQPENTEYPKDTFNNRVNIGGWGVSSSGHVWEGGAADDPYYYDNPQSSLYSVSSFNGKIALTASSAQDTVSTLGPSRGDNIEAVAIFAFTTTTPHIGGLRLGLRCQLSRYNGKPDYIGYTLDVGTQGTAIIRKKTAYGSVPIDISSVANLGAEFLPNEQWRAKFQIQGSVLKARLWRSSETEPTTWQVTANDSTFASGRVLWGGLQTSATTRTVVLYDLTTQAPTIDVPPPSRDFLTAGTSTVTPVSDRSFTINVTYSDDENNTSFLTARYKPSIASSWITYQPTTTNGLIAIDRTSKVATFTISDLQPETSYDVEMTWHDTDGVLGANPSYLTYETPTNLIRPKSVRAESVTTNSAIIVTEYDRDLNNTARVALHLRPVTREVVVVNDFFTDARDGELLQNIPSTINGENGAGWKKHPTIATQAVNAIKQGRYFYVNTINSTDKAFYQPSNDPLQLPQGTQNYDVEATFYAAALNGRTGVVGRLSGNSETYYGAGIDSANQRWELFQMTNGVKKLLGTAPFSGEVGVVYTIRLSLNDGHKDLYVNNELLITDSSNELNYRGWSGWYTTDLVGGDPRNQWRLGSFKLSNRLPQAPYAYQGDMTKNVGPHTFHKVLANLYPDTVYEALLHYADEGIIQQSAVVFMTTGSSTTLDRILAGSSATAANISVLYSYDLNNNSLVDLQYRAVGDETWTTVPPSKITVRRDLKTFQTTLAGLSPTTTYEVRAVITDPEGIIEGGVDTISGLFTTQGYSIEESKQRKEYVWKMYDPKGNYLCTIPDAPDPEFSIYENGGVTDLTFTLPRKMSETQSQRLINFQNILDIWAIDPSSNGMGPNLIDDPDCDPAIGGWSIPELQAGTYQMYFDGVGPDGSTGIQLGITNTIYTVMSTPMFVAVNTPLVLTMMTRAIGGNKMRVYIYAYDANDEHIDTSEEYGETLGGIWQKLRLEYRVPPNTSYIRVVAVPQGVGTYNIDKISLLPKELLVYRGRIESYTPKIDENGESVDIEVLGLASTLSDDYIEFMQFVETQPQNDIEAGRPNLGPKDPADMMRLIINEAKRVNPFFTLYYTADSIRNTGYLMQYTFRDQQIRSAMDKVRGLCPSGWHYFIEPDGKVVLRGAEHAPTHVLSIGREILRFEVERSIRNLKNYIRIKGRQDEDKSEPDGHGSINYIAFDQESINKYGKRALYVRDAQITDPDTAKIVGDGRLEEHNREEQRVNCYVPDEKSEMVTGGSLRGYNIESFRVGDNVIILDPIAGPRNTYWDQFNWDEGKWDTNDVFQFITDVVPIKTIKMFADHVELELSERPPSSVSDFSKFYRLMAQRESEGN